MTLFFYCMILKITLKLSPMKNQPNIEKIICQHAELDEFFTGGFTIKASGSQAKELQKTAVEIGKCCKCGLQETRANTVPGEGNPNARLVFVGEAPGADEDIQARPFVGRAGQLLDKIIASMGLKRTDVFICNIIKCRPPENRDPRLEEITFCLPYLQRQLEIIQPEIIVALGAHAAKTLLQTDKPIGQLRGKFHDYQITPNSEPVRLMPTYHPAYLLRNYSTENRRRVWEDMKKVTAQLGIDKN